MVVRVCCREVIVAPTQRANSWMHWQRSGGCICCCKKRGGYPCTTFACMRWCGGAWLGLGLGLRPPQVGCSGMYACMHTYVPEQCLTVVCADCLTVGPDGVSLRVGPSSSSSSHLTGGSAGPRFVFDKVFGPEAGNDFLSSAGEYVQLGIDGLQSCILCYGQQVLQCTALVRVCTHIPAHTYTPLHTHTILTLFLS